MKIVVFSDSHGDFNALNKIVLKNKDADMFLHLGDGEQDFEDIKMLYPQYQFEGVCGNCDFREELPVFHVLEVCNKKIFMTHGHAFGVRFGTQYIETELLKHDADIGLFGHTHIPVTKLFAGRYIMNPGSVSLPRQMPRIKTYGIIELHQDGRVNMFHKEVPSH